MDQPSTTPVLWFYGSPVARADAGPLAAELSTEATVLLLGPGGEPAPHLDLGTEPDLALALESCPKELRPWLLVGLDHGQAPPGADGLPCALIDASQSLAAEQVLEAARQGRTFAWLERVQVNLPLNDLLGRYRHISDIPLNLEVGINAWSLDNLGEAGLAQAKSLLQGRRLTCHLPFMDLVPASPDPMVASASLKRLNQAARWAIDLGCVQAVMHTGMEPHLHRDPKAFAERLAAGLAPMARELEAAGIALALENVFEYDPGPLLLARSALEQAGCSRVGLCLDLGHALAFSKTAQDVWWDALAPHLIEVHLHDNDGEDDLHLPPGQGKTDWAMVERKLQAMAARPVLTLEPHRESHLWESLRGLESLWGSPDWLD